VNFSLTALTAWEDLLIMIDIDQNRPRSEINRVENALSRIAVVADIDSSWPLPLLTRKKSFKEGASFGGLVLDLSDRRRR
jgi:hypothetical protein